MGTPPAFLIRRIVGMAGLRRTVELQPAHYTAHYKLAMLLASRGKAQEAAAHYRKAIAAHYAASR